MAMFSLNIFGIICIFLIVVMKGSEGNDWAFRPPIPLPRHRYYRYSRGLKTTYPPPEFDVEWFPPDVPRRSRAGRGPSAWETKREQGPGGNYYQHGGWRGSWKYFL